MNAIYVLLVICEGNQAISGGIYLKKVGNAEFSCFHCCFPEQDVKHTIELHVILDVMTLM